MKIALAACSNGCGPEKAGRIEKLCEILADMGINTVRSPHILAKTDAFSGTDRERAQGLMRFYEDDTIDVICDISGGDLANGILKYLNYDLIASSGKTFWGYSDLTTVINAIYTMTGKSSVLYQISHLTGGKLQQQRFADYFSKENEDLFDLDYEFLQGTSMEGVVAGGNIRCFLKLAGTGYWPDMDGKILLLEAMGGESGMIASLFNQLDLIGVFERIGGVLLGTFTNYEKAHHKRSVFDLLRDHISPDLPVASTRDIGHGLDAKAIRIGEYMKF